MCAMTARGFEGKGSPDRVDALVWALTDLIITPSAKWRRPACGRCEMTGMRRAGDPVRRSTTEERSSVRCTGVGDPDLAPILAGAAPDGAG